VDEELAVADACADLSSLSVCRASDKLVVASSTELFRSVGSRTASTSPAVTLWPTAACTAETVPATANAASARSTSLNDPAAATLWLTEPRATTAVR
jgi:hypothetical protein